MVVHVIAENAGSPVIQASKDGAYMPRHAAIRVGVPVAVPALAVNRLCGSGFQSVVTAAQVNAL